jgi:hypothetical protein
MQADTQTCQMCLDTVTDTSRGCILPATLARDVDGFMHVTPYFYPLLI